MNISIKIVFLLVASFVFLHCSAFRINLTDSKNKISAHGRTVSNQINSVTPSQGGTRSGDIVKSIIFGQSLMILPLQVSAVDVFNKSPEVVLAPLGYLLGCIVPYAIFNIFLAPKLGMVDQNKIDKS